VQSAGSPLETAGETAGVAEERLSVARLDARPASIEPEMSAVPFLPPPAGKEEPLVQSEAADRERSGSGPFVAPEAQPAKTSSRARSGASDPLQQALRQLSAVGRRNASTDDSAPNVQKMVPAAPPATSMARRDAGRAEHPSDGGPRTAVRAGASMPVPQARTGDDVTVRVHIGRIDVRAASTPAVQASAPPRPDRSATRPMTLEEYVRRRDGGGA
jgi:hypothetical protein